MKHRARWFTLVGLALGIAGSMAACSGDGRRATVGDAGSGARAVARVVMGGAGSARAKAMAADVHGRHGSRAARTRRAIVRRSRPRRRAVSAKLPVVRQTDAA